MRIAFHVPRASHLKPGFSGDKILVRGLIEGLGRRGHDVRIVSRLNVRNLWRGRVGREELRSEMRRVRMEMENFAPDAWLVYGASTTNPDLFGWRLLAEQTPRPRKYGFLATDLGSGKRLPLRWRRLFAWVHRHSLAQSDWMAAYHPNSRDDLIRHGLPEQRVFLMPPAVWPWQQIPTMREARRHLGLPLDGPVLFSASRFPHTDERDAGKMRMLLDLVEASTALPPDSLLVIAGDGPGRAAVERAIVSRSNRSLVRLVGPVKHEAMSHYYAACDFFVYPHPVDRPWLAVLEAQACGRPVVTMRTRSAELTLRAGETGLLASDMEEFRQAIRTLAANRQQAQSMGRAAAHYVAVNHSLDVRLNQIERLLEEPNGETQKPREEFAGSQGTTDSQNRGAATFAPDLSETSSYRI